MRDANYFNRLLDDNPNATVGLGLAAAAVYATLYGACEAEQHSAPEFKTIYRNLRTSYGENLSTDDVRSAMLSAVDLTKSIPSKNGGTAPNTSLVLTDDELAFIEEQFGGSKSAAIHAALAALRRTE
jgi:hypothetical protein